jgi:hypothetical protein
MILSVKGESEQIQDLKDIITLLKDKQRNRREFMELLGMKSTNMYYRIELLLKKGLVKYMRDILKPTPYSQIHFSLVRHYKSYTVISGIDNVLCKKFFDEKKMAMFPSLDLTKQYESVYPLPEVDSFIGEMLRSARNITFITERDKKYAEVTKEWIRDNLDISKFTIIFIDKENTTGNKINEIKRLYNNLSYFSYNIVLEHDLGVIKALRYLEDRKDSTTRVKNDSIVKNFHGMISLYHANQEFKILKFVYESWVKEYILKMQPRS